MGGKNIEVRVVSTRFVPFIAVDSIFYLFVHNLILNFLFLHTGEGRKRGREISMCGCLSCAPTGDLARNPGVCPDWESNRQPFGS